MLRSRLKRMQPLHPSTGEGTLKRAFVSPVSSSSGMSKTSTTTPETLIAISSSHQSTDAISAKAKSFKTPFKSPQSSSSAISVDTSSDENKRYCFKCLSIVTMNRSTMYYKSGPKKKKTYLDGILFVDKKTFSLFVISFE